MKKENSELWKRQSTNKENKSIRVSTEDYTHQLITLDDLQQFKEQLFKELEAPIKPSITQPKKWLKSHEVQRYLKISPGTLQHLKTTGVLPYTRIGSVHFYDIEDIQQILQNGKINDRQ